MSRVDREGRFGEKVYTTERERLEGRDLNILLVSLSSSQQVQD